MPRVIQSATDHAKTEYNAIVVSETLGAIFAGGMSTNKQIHQGTVGQVALVTRIDVATEHTIWTKTYSMAVTLNLGKRTEQVNAMALSPDSTKLVVVVFRSNSSHKTSLF